jgi:hypothetical protein
MLGKCTDIPRADNLLSTKPSTNSSTNNIGGTKGSTSWDYVNRVKFESPRITQNQKPESYALVKRLTTPQQNRHRHCWILPEEGQGKLKPHVRHGLIHQVTRSLCPTQVTVIDGGRRSGDQLLLLLRGAAGDAQRPRPNPQIDTDAGSAKKFTVSKTKETPPTLQSHGMIERSLETILKHLRNVVSTHNRDC